MNDIDLLNDQTLVRHISEYYTTTEFSNEIKELFGERNNLNSTNNCINDIYDNFSLLHINARSLQKNYDDLNILLSSLVSFKFSAIGITETWFHSNSPPIFDIDEYDLIRADRNTGRGGGVAIYLHNKLKFRKRPNLHIEGAEDIFIEIITENDKNIIIGVVYRPPNHPIDTFLNDLDVSLHNISQENKYVYLMGDFNIDLLSSINQHTSSHFLNILSSFSFYPHINKHTRITPTSSTLIDNIFSNVIDQHSLNGILYYDISDHLPIFTIVKHPGHTHKPSTNLKHNKIRKETKQNIESLKLDLTQEQWLDIFQTNDVNQSYENFINKLLFYYDKNIPLVRQKSYKKIKNPWITKGIINSIITRNKLYKKSLREPSQSNHDKYKKYRNVLTSIIRLSRKIYYSQKIESKKDNNTSLWQIVKDLLGTKAKNTPKTFKDGDIEISDPEKIANKFNSYFVNIGPNLASKINAPRESFKKYLNEPFHKTLFLRPTDHQEILNIVKSLKPSASTGYDGISVNLLKKIINCIIDPLIHISNLSITSGTCPDSLKIAKVIPIFKKDDSSLISNYRPISILPAISKILEKILYTRLYEFVNNNNLIHSNQYGFRKLHSTDFAIVQLCDEIVHALSRKEHCVGVFKDLSKAFDTIDHLILKYKLNNYGVRGTALEWFQSYLTNRKQYVSFQSNDSQKMTIKCGVPQGSILGPLLFVLFINDLPSQLSEGTDVVLYADDTKIWRKIASPLDCSILQTDIDSLNDWAIRNKMKFHPSKCKVLSVSSRQLPLNSFSSYNLGGTLLDSVSSENDLGVEITPKLSWNMQCDRIYSKACQQLGIIRRNGHIVTDSKSRRSLYLSLVRSQFENCSIVWRPTTVSHTNKLESLQKRAIKWIFSEENLSYPPEKYISKCREINILPLAKKFDLNDLIFFHKVVNNLVPVPLPEYLKFYQGGSRLRKCHLDVFSLVCSIIPRSSQKTTNSQNPLSKSFFYRTHLLWNSLPFELRKTSDPSKFKSELLKYMWSSLSNEDPNSSSVDSSLTILH